MQIIPIESSLGDGRDGIGDGRDGIGDGSTINNNMQRVITVHVYAYSYLKYHSMISL